MECLCKLLATIGHLLDASAKGHMVMDAYFMRMMKIGQGPGLETRHRYLIKARTIPIGCAATMPRVAVQCI